MLDESKLNINIHSCRALLIGIWTRELTYEQAHEYFEELKELCISADAVPAESLVQKVNIRKASTYFGSGKIEEINQIVKEKDIQLIIIDDDLTSTQVKNLEKKIEVKLLDRSGLILQIFRDRAKSAQAKAQVELAHLEYMLPRLTRMWTHLSRERGGIGMKGAGEQEIETDRRIIRTRIAKLKKELVKIEKQNLTQRKGRNQMPRVALVGYTNAGKSTIMNLFTNANVYAQDQLFATLDTTVRKAVVHNVPFLISDTVGFIRKIPTHLVESFKSTLAEAKEADILLHVVDLSNLQYVEHIQVVNRTLAELEANDIDTILVFNKIDKYSEDEINDFKSSWMNTTQSPTVFISAATKQNINELKEILIGYLQNSYKNKYPGLHHYF